MQPLTFLKKQTGDRIIEVASTERQGRQWLMISIDRGDIRGPLRVYFRSDELVPLAEALAEAAACLGGKS